MISFLRCLLILLIVPGLAVAQWHTEGKLPVRIALIDSGLTNSAAFSPYRIPGYDFVDNDSDPAAPCNTHGDKTAAILLDLIGGADVELMPLRVLDCNGVGTEQRLVNALQFAQDNGADMVQAIVLVSSAWGIAGYNQPGGLQAFCASIAAFDGLVISSAGNEGLDLDAAYRYPPSCRLDNQIIVGGSDKQDGLWSSSNRGSAVNLAAPAVDIVGAGNGTSYAAPQLTALAARLYWLDQSQHWAALKARVLEHVDVLPQFASTATGGRLSAFYCPDCIEPQLPPLSGSMLLYADMSSTNDMSGAGNHLQCSSCPALLGGVASFANNWLSRSNAALNGAFPAAGAQAYSIVADIRINDIADRQPIVAKQGGGERGFLLQINGANGRLQAELWPAGASSPTMINGTAAVTVGQWRRVAITHDTAGQVRLYLNGAQDGTGVSAMPRNNAQALEIGRYYWSSGYSRYLRGAINNIWIFDYALTGAEIGAL